MSMYDIPMKWKSQLSPIYGDRECQSMWKLYRAADRPMDDFDADLEKLVHGYPIQYLIGYTWFYDLKISVNEATLIPRPETEELVYYLLQLVENQGKNLSVLDLGTGSGCIPLALKNQRKHWQIFGLDRSPEALEVANQNARDTHLDVGWVLGDILSWDLSELQDRTFDILTANPPYIPEVEKENMAHTVIDYEPHVALFTEDAKGLSFYQAIAENAYRQLNPEGWIFLEIHENHGPATMSLFQRPEYEKVAILNDLQGKPRILYAKKSAGST